MTVTLQGVVLSAMPGDDIRDVIQEAMWHAAWPGGTQTYLDFNGVVIHVERGKTFDELLAHWKRLMEDAAAHYRATHPSADDPGR